MWYSRLYDETEGEHMPPAWELDEPTDRFLVAKSKLREQVDNSPGDRLLVKSLEMDTFVEYTVVDINGVRVGRAVIEFDEEVKVNA